MKLAARALVIVALLCACLFAVHGFYLVKSDMDNRVAQPVTVQVIPVPMPQRAAPVKAVASEAGDPPAGPPDPCSPRGQSIGMVCNPPKPEIRKGTIGMLPGQSTNLENKRYRKVLIQSQFPIRVMSGSCHSDYTVQFFCEGDPSDVFITDMRPHPIFHVSVSNPVSVTLTEF